MLGCAARSWTLRPLERLRDQLRDDLEAARERVASIGKALKTAQGRLTKADRAFREARRDANSLQREADAAQAEVSALDEAVEAAEEGAAPLEELEAAAAAAEADPAELEEAERAHSDALRREGAAGERLARARQAAEAVPAAEEAAGEAERELHSRENLLRAASPQGVPLLATMRAIDGFERHANDAVSTLCSMGLRFSISDRRRAPEVLIEARDETGPWRDYRTFSGGERMRFDIAMRVGLCRVTGVRADTLIIDEGHGALDPESAGRLQMLIVAARRVRRDGRGLDRDARPGSPRRVRRVHHGRTRPQRLARQDRDLLTAQWGRGPRRVSSAALQRWQRTRAHTAVCD